MAEKKAAKKSTKELAKSTIGKALDVLVRLTELIGSTDVILAPG